MHVAQREEEGREMQIPALRRETKIVRIEVKIKNTILEY